MANVTYNFHFINISKIFKIMPSIIIKEQFILVINSEVAEGLVYNLMMGCLDNNIVTCVQYFKMDLCRTYDWNVNRHANVGAITDGYE